LRRSYSLKGATSIRADKDLRERDPSSGIEEKTVAAVRSPIPEMDVRKEIGFSKVEININMQFF
jgi:hypothetical protein